ncbi:PAS domain S-box protein [Fulvivirga sp. RKSG066]|nr:PAS domain S-box protein [Fulvivirga aurantia]
MSLARQLIPITDRVEDKLLVMSMAVLATLTVFLDSNYPLGVAAGIPYILIVLISFEYKNQPFILLTATFCSALTAVGFYFSTYSISPEMMFVNRLVIFGTIWITTGLLISLSRQRRVLIEGNKDYDKTVNELEQVMEELESKKSALEETEQIFRKVINHSPIGIALIDLEGICIEANAALCQILGYSQQELHGTDFRSLGHSESRGENSEKRTLLLHDEIKTYEIIQRYKHFEGKYIWCQENVSLIRDENNEPSYFITQIQDITERKKAEAKVSTFNKRLEKKVAQRTKELKRAKEQFEDLYHNSPDMYASVSTKTKCITACNDTFLKNTGYKRSDVIDQPYKKFYHSDCYPAIEVALQEFFKNEEVKNAELILLDKAGNKVDVLLNVTAIKDDEGNIIESRSCWKDITKRKQAEQEVLELNNQLKIRLENLDTVNKELESFSYSVSHDLRSPLRTIHGFCEALEEDYSDQLPDKARDYLRRVVGASKRMGQLIDDILNLSRISRKDFKATEIDITVLAKEVGREQMQLAHSNATIEVEDGLRAKGDIGLIKIAFENLIGNSIKYADKERPLKIEIGSKSINDITTYFVKDNGVGFDMNYVDKLFGAFQRLHSDKEFSGTGIGLATVNRIISRHNGRIWAESEIDKGSTFYFTLLKK